MSCSTMHVQLKNELPLPIVSLCNILQVSLFPTVAGQITQLTLCSIAQVGLKYELPLLSPVDDAGVFTSEAGPFKGLQVISSCCMWHTA